MKTKNASFVCIVQLVEPNAKKRVSIGAIVYTSRAGFFAGFDIRESVICSCLGIADEEQSEILLASAYLFRTKLEKMANTSVTRAEVDSLIARRGGNIQFSEPRFVEGVDGNKILEETLAQLHS